MAAGAVLRVLLVIALMPVAACVKPGATRLPAEEAIVGDWQISEPLSEQIDWGSILGPDSMKLLRRVQFERDNVFSESGGVVRFESKEPRFGLRYFLSRNKLEVRGPQPLNLFPGKIDYPHPQRRLIFDIEVDADELVLIDERGNQQSFKRAR
jgi:hypothetical protein